LESLSNKRYVCRRRCPSRYRRKLQRNFVSEEPDVLGFQLQVDDVSVLGADAQGIEDDISDPEEDSLAGQMAALRGGSVKKIVDDEDSDESDTDGEDRNASSSDSD
jgi:translocation protein SEC63